MKLTAILAIIQQATMAYHLPPKLLPAVIQVESNYKIDAVNPNMPKTPQAKKMPPSFGLGQLTYWTARLQCGLMTKAQIFNPRNNIMCAAKVLRAKLDDNDTLVQALSAYNAGTYTRKNCDYVNKILSAMNEPLIACGAT